MKKYFKTTERSSYHVPLSAEEYKLWVHGLVQWHSDCYCHWYVGNFNRHLVITYRPLMVSVHLQNLFSWTRNVHLQYAWEVKYHGKTYSQKFCKKYFLWTMPRKRTIYRKVKNVQISGSVLYKNKTQELVFFLAGGTFTLTGKINSQNNMLVSEKSQHSWRSVFTWP